VGKVMPTANTLASASASTKNLHDPSDDPHPISEEKKEVSIRL
jgi:hypothetical protein